MRWIGCLLVPVIVPVGALFGQTPLPLEPGQQVRIRYTDAPTKRTDGRIVTVGSDSLVLRTKRFRVDAHGHRTVDSVVTTIPLSQVATIAKRTGRKSAAGRGALVGGVSMSLVGLIASASDWCIGEEDGGACVIGAAAVGAAEGAAVGAILGAILRSDKWVDVPINNVRMSIAQGSVSRFGLTASIAF